MTSLRACIDGAAGGEEDGVASGVAIVGRL
jgi:hypothetical protein